ncbi:cation:proton antiporter [uncultured Marinococcus sp.]|uniref:cation:proton antiporter n=1 Tax=uncultured Marinococcus sp. TaxID=487012 RepID=UPI00262E6E7C|nr:cation:proton antiporter [uncultured Marinococcus sp.]
MPEMPDLLAAGLMLLVLFIGGWISFKMRFPDVIIYLLIGIVVSSWLADSHLLYFAGEIGIVLLFFMLGMEFPVRQLILVATKVFRAGILDIILSFGVTVGITLAFGLGWLEALIIGGVAYATSSSITAKMLENSKRMVNPESEFILGLLIFEDLFAPVLVALLVSMTVGSGVTVGMLGWTFVQIIILVAGAVLLGIFVFRKLRSFVDRYMDEDFFLLFVFGIALTYGGIALYLNLSEVLGAFLAGIILAEVKRSDVLEGLVVRFRDLLLPMFFVYFGTTIEVGEGVPMIPMLLVLLFWSVAAKILVGFAGGKLYGLSSKVALRAGLSLTQRGEFSIIVAALATGTLRTFSSIFILLSALVGVYLFQKAPELASSIYGKKRGKKPV